MANARLLERLLPAMAAEAGISVAELRELMIPVDMDTTADVSSAEDDVSDILIAVRRCHANETQTLAMAQRTTGLPTAATDSSLISKVTAPRVPSGECWESVREDQTRVFPLLTW